MKIKRGKTVKINIYYTYCMLFRFLEWYITFLRIFMKKVIVHYGKMHPGNFVKKREMAAEKRKKRSCMV